MSSKPSFGHTGLLQLLLFLNRFKFFKGALCFLVMKLKTTAEHEAFFIVDNQQNCY